MGEQDHLADRGDAGQQHHEAVDSHAHPAGWRQAVLERAQVIGIDALRLRVAELLERGLRLEPTALLDRIVELAVRVRDLASADDQLETLGERGVITMGSASGETSSG